MGGNSLVLRMTACEIELAIPPHSCELIDTGALHA
jgi:hypothetical protein